MPYRAEQRFASRFSLAGTHAGYAFGHDARQGIAEIPLEYL